MISAQTSYNATTTVSPLHNNAGFAHIYVVVQGRYTLRSVPGKWSCLPSNIDKSIIVLGLFRTQHT